MGRQSETCRWRQFWFRATNLAGWLIARVRARWTAWTGAPAVRVAHAPEGFPRSLRLARELVATGALPRLRARLCTADGACGVLAINDGGAEGTIWLSSLTKPLVAFAVLRVADEGLLRLDDEVGAHLPAFESVRGLTIEHLLLHLSGLDFQLSSVLADGTSAFDHYRMGLPRARSLAHAAGRLSRAARVAAPGTEFRYGAGHTLLCAILESVLGTSVAQALRSYVFVPLRMHETRFLAAGDDGDKHADGGRQPLLRRTRGMFHRSADYAIFYDPPDGYGNLFSTVDDYAHFVRCLCDGGVFDGVRLLREETMAAATTDQLGRFGLAPPVESMPGVWYGGFSYLGAVTSTTEGASLLPAGRDAVQGTICWGGANSLFFSACPRTRSGFVYSANTIGVPQSYRLPLGTCLTQELAAA